jgi:hypothetical protein
VKTVLHWLPVALCLAFLLSLASLQRDRALRGENDFVQLYTGATLAGGPDLYSRAANLAAVKATLGFTMETVVYTRPPFYAALLKPLSFLPYRAAYALFSLASLASILWFVIRFQKECPSLPFFAAMSLPALSALCGGQDTPLLLAILGASVLLTRSERDVAAGLVLSLVAIKFHLFLFLPVLLVVKRRWRILGGGAAGTLLLIVYGLLVCGVDAARQYVNVLRDPWINPSATAMPNLHGLTAILGGDALLEIGLIAVVVAAFGWTLRQCDEYELLLAAGLVAGLLVAFHSGIADTLILLPAFVCVIRTSSNVPLRAASALLLTPIPYFISLSGAPYSAVLPVALLMLSIGFGFSCRLPLVADLAQEAVTPRRVVGRLDPFRR